MVIRLIFLLLFSCATERKKHPPFLIEGDWGSTPKTLREQIGQTLSDHVYQFKNCYDKNGSKMSGQITLHFTIKRDGRVQRAGIGESELPMKLKVCLIEKIYAVVFPRLGKLKELKVTQPLKF